MDSASAGLSMLRVLGPDTAELLAGNVEDHAQYEQLLGVGFSAPSFEQEVRLCTLITNPKNRIFDTTFHWRQWHLIELVVGRKKGTNNS